MLSYRHAFHAGNSADVLKHWTLVTILQYYQLKDKPFTYIDTHAGAGLYQLTSEAAQKTGEYNTGIQQVLENVTVCPPDISSYLRLIQQLNSNTLTYYPGSPWLAAQLLRPSDRLALFELHPQDYSLLKQQFTSDKRIHTYQEDGLNGLKRLVPPSTKRAVILIDPSYELKTDYQLVIKAVQQAYKRFATGTYIVWYPVIYRQRVQNMLKELQHSDIADILQIELCLQADSDSLGMSGSGLFIINPPWTFKQQAQNVLPWLQHQLGHHTAFITIQQITPEK